MANDAELDRLKTARDRAFTSMESACEARNEAGDARGSARELLSKALNARQRAFEEQDASWKALQDTRDDNNPRIKELKALQESSFNSMKLAFDSANVAAANGDSDGVTRDNKEGRRHRKEMWEYVAKIKRRIGENQAARERHNTARAAFEQAKIDCNVASLAFEQAKARHIGAQEVASKSKTVFDKAVVAFKTGLAEAKAESNERRKQRRLLAEMAGVPVEYQDNVWLSPETDGNTNIYFGGVGHPNGPGHGCYVVDRQDTVISKRDPQTVQV